MTITNNYPYQDWNFGRNGAQLYINQLLDQWPTDVYFSGSGENIITGNRNLPNTPDKNPVKLAFKLWNNALQKGRSSWDQIAVLFAVRPQYFKVDSIGSLRQNEQYQTFWDSKMNRKTHYKVILNLDNEEIEDIIENLMGELPDN